MTDTIQLDRETAERILASLMGCHETTAGSYSYLLINICDLSHALAAQPVQPAPLTDAELPELPRPDRNAWPHGFHDLYTAQQMRDYTQQATAPILAKLATQVALVEKCMVAMNENADKGEKVEAELARLKAQPAAWTVLLQQSQANFQKNFGGNVAANWVYNDLRELFADATPVQPVQPALTDLSRLEPFVHGLGKAILREFQERVRTGGAG